MFKALTIPIVQGPMLGVSGVELAVAVSRAGGLGSLAAAGLTAPAMREAIRALRAATDRPFLVNIFVLDPVSPDRTVVASAIERLRPWRERYGLPPQVAPAKWAESFADQFAVMLEEAPPFVSFTFGILTRARVAALQARGSRVIGTATTLAEARAWSAVGADAICAQGFEAGGHRGTFLKDVSESLVGTLALTRSIVAALDLPVVAAGGVTDGAGVAAVLALGASAAQIGTAYLLAEEAMTSAVWRKAISEAGDDPTRLTRAISGRYARGIDNEFMRALRPVESEIPAYPVQNALTQELRAAATKAHSPDVLSLWAGQGVGLARPGGAADITAALWRDAREALRANARRWADD
jgi:nitronate monooxygenase